MGSRRARRLAGVHAELDKEDEDEREGKRERERERGGRVREKEGTQRTALSRASETAKVVNGGGRLSQS